MMCIPAECLEARTLLSNIAVTVQAGVMTLTGDSADHVVAASVVGGKLELVGSGGTNLTFNGSTSTTVDVSLPGTLKAINIDLPGAGNNTVTVDASGLPTIAGNMSVKFGDGTESFTLTNASIKGNLSVSSGNGSDVITLSDSTTGAVSIKAGNGANVIQLAGDTTTNVSIATGNGSDTIGLNGDTTGDVDIFSGDGGDSITLSDNTSGKTSIVTGSGEDTIELFSDNLTGISINSGTADDFILLSGVTLRARTIVPDLEDNFNHCGDDPDDYSRSSRAADVLSIKAGGGNDTVELDSVTSKGVGVRGSKWQINLGAGSNSLTMQSDTNRGFLNVSATGTGDNVVTINDSTFEKNVRIALPNGTEQIILNGDSFLNPVTLSTGTGIGSIISVDDSRFDGRVKFAMAGPNAQLNLETAALAGVGTIFNRPVLTAVTGASAVVNIGTNLVGNTIVFNKKLKIAGGFPAATVNVRDANSTFVGPLVLDNATRIDL